MPFYICFNRFEVIQNVNLMFDTIFFLEMFLTQSICAELIKISWKLFKSCDLLFIVYEQTLRKLSAVWISAGFYRNFLLVTLFKQL